MKSFNSNQPIVVVPAGTGKTTFARRYPGVFSDPDSARNPLLEPQLRELRRDNKWTEHNRIWHQLLCTYDKTVPAHTIFLAHSLADAEAVAACRARPTKIAFLLIPSALHEQQIAERGDEMRALARRNYDEACADARRTGFPVYTSLAELALAIVPRVSAR